MIRSVIVLFVVATAVAMTAFAGSPFDVSRYTIDGGGVLFSASNDGTFVLSGTIGQPDAGFMTGGDFTLTGGFWYGQPLGDCNFDGIVGASDHFDFVHCVGGPGEPIFETCVCFDVNGDGSVDLADFARNQTAFVRD
jgi:hypothetical protein